MSPYFCEIDVFCLIYFFCFPYFDHDTVMHHASHAHWKPLVIGRPTYWTSLILFVLHFVWGEAPTLHSAYLRKLLRTEPGHRFNHRRESTTSLIGCRYNL